MRVARTDRTAYGTQFNAAAIERLPDSGGVYGLIERSDPLVVTELIEGGGAYLEPQRLAASGASWTQTSFRLGDADVTDPDRTGFAMFYPNLDALQAVSVTTAGLHPGGYGSGTCGHARAEDAGADLAAHDRTLRLAAGAAVGRRSSGRAVDRASPGGERRQLYPERAGDRSSGNPRRRGDGRLEPVRARSARILWPVAPVRYRRIWSTARRRATTFDCSSKPIDWRCRPRAARCSSIRDCQQHDRSLLLSSAWNRTSHGGLAWSANLTYGYASSTPPLSGTAIVSTMERLRDGPVDELASSSDSRRHRTSINWRGDPGPLRLWGSAPSD